VLGLFDVSVLASAAMGPAYSLAVTMGPMVAAAGSNATLALVLLGAVMSCVAIAFSRLSQTMPSAGSSFSWAASAFGSRTGAYAAWLLLLSNYFATMTTALPAATYYARVIRAAARDLTALGCAGRHDLDRAEHAAAVRGLAADCVHDGGLSGRRTPRGRGASAVAACLAHPVPEHLAPPALPNPFAGIVTAMVLGIWMTDGWEVSASASEETTGAPQTPGRGGLRRLARDDAPAGRRDARVRPRRFGRGLRRPPDRRDVVRRRSPRRTVLAPHDRGDGARLDRSHALDDDAVSLAQRVRDGPRRRPARSARSLERARRAGELALAVFGCTGAFTLLTGFWPTAASVLNLVLNGTSVFLGALFAMSAFAAIKLRPVRRARDDSPAALASPVEREE
jgi:hypothetical protein